MSALFQKSLQLVLASLRAVSSYWPLCTLTVNSMMGAFKQIVNLYGLLSSNGKKGKWSRLLMAGPLLDMAIIHKDVNLINGGRCGAHHSLFARLHRFRCGALQ